MLIKEIKNIPISSFLGGGSWSLSNLQKITILMGKNGSGKSTLLEVLATTLRTTSSGDEKLLCDNGENEKVVKFEKIVPERGGFYEQDGNVTTSINNDQNFIFEASKGNSQINYRKIVASKLQSFVNQYAFLKSLENKSPYSKVDEIIEYLNGLLPSKYIVKRKIPGNSLAVYGREEGGEIPQPQLSSGEREIFSLAIDILIKIFSAEAENVHLVLLLDEPDVHLHPDLQNKLYQMLIGIVSNNENLQIIIGTHSPVFMAPQENSGIIWMQEGITDMRSEKIPSWANTVILTVGKGMLSPILGGVKTLLVEGPDDYLIWHQAVKSSNGKLKVVPFDCGSKDQIPKYIRLINKLIDSIGERATTGKSIFALRDNDGENVRNQKVGSVRRFSTVCHEIENCILSDEVSTDDQRVKLGVTDLKNTDIKSRMSEITEIILSGSNDWQRKIGSAIGQIYHVGNIEESSSKENSIINYIGKDFLVSLQEE